MYVEHVHIAAHYTQHDIWISSILNVQVILQLNKAVQYLLNFQWLKIIIFKYQPSKKSDRRKVSLVQISLLHMSRHQ